MYKKKLYYGFLLLFFYNTLFSQNIGCIDNNKIVKYTLPTQHYLEIGYASSKVNFLLGDYKEQPIDSGVIICKTYLDNIVWAKKYSSPAKNMNLFKATILPDSSIIAFSNTSDAINQYIVRFSSVGTALWAKKYNLNINTNLRSNGCRAIQYYNNHIYISCEFTSILQNQNEIYKCISKIDLDGNIVWSKTFVTDNYPITNINGGISNIIDDTLFFTSNLKYNNINLSGKIDSAANTTSKLNANTGEVITSYRIKIAASTFIKGVNIYYTRINQDNSIILIGDIVIPFIQYPYGISIGTGLPFALLLDANYNFIKGKYYTASNANGILNFAQNVNYCLGLNKEVGFSSQNDDLKYILRIDSNLNIKYSKILNQSSVPNYVVNPSYYIDEKKADIIGFSGYINPNTNYLQFFRINDLDSTFTNNCFSKDTSIFTANSFSIIKDTFQWPTPISGALYSEPITLIEKPFTITKEVLCTQTSVCDTIKINGADNFCLSNPYATFTLHKNPNCLRKTNWVIDTTFIKIINQPNDTTINVQLLQPYHGYIRATFEGCVLKDSLFINVRSPKALLNLGKDSTFCPGKTIILNAGVGFKNYTWQDGSTNQSYTVTQPGLYYVTATDSCNNIFKDTIVIKPIDVTFDFQYPKSICIYDTATVITNPKLYNYTWTPTNTCFQENNTLKFFPENTTIYTITANRFMDCTLTDTLLINVIKCPIYFYVPSAFTPNNDYLNDNFKPIISGKLEQYKFEIYNRFGEMVFSSNNNNIGWNGKLKGSAQPNGTFIWTCYYKFRNEQAVSKKGIVMLLH